MIATELELGGTDGVKGLVVTCNIHTKEKEV